MDMGHDGEARRRFLVHLAIALVTLGLYMPVWLALRDREIRTRAELSSTVSCAWALGAGAALAVISRPLFGVGSPSLAFGLSLLAIGVFLAGVYQAARTLALALDRWGLDTPAPAAPVTGALAVVFVGIELGNLTGSWFLRAPVFVALLAVPYAFWRLHLGYEAVRRRAPQAAPTATS